jgi:hypothetical protein
LETEQDLALAWSWFEGFLAILDFERTRERAELPAARRYRAAIYVIA